MSNSTVSSSTSAPVTFTGIATGLNTTSIIQKLMSLDQEPLTALQTQETNLQNQESIYEQLGSDLQAFQTAAQTLSDPSSFQTVSADSSNTNVATISTTGNALPGNFNLTVNQLAQAQMILSSAQSSASSALGLSGTVVVNGQSLVVNSSDTLDSIAGNINGLNAGVTASIVDGGSGNAYISLTSTQTGTANAMQLSDLSGTALESLGLTNGTTTVGNPITDGAASYGFSSQTASLQSQMGATTSGTIQINGTNVSVNYATDSLDSIAANISSNVSGVNATVQAVDNNGTTTYQLQITGTSGTPTFTDSGDVLQTLGILQQGVSNQVVQAQNAEYSLDNVNLVSSSNTLTSAIPGATITLLSGTKSDPGTSDLSLTQDTSGIVTNLQNFASAYNAVNDYIGSESTLNTQTFATGPLFGDPVAQQVSTGLSDMLFENVPGLSGAYQNLASLGFTLDESGDLQLNTSVVQQALSTNPTAVQDLFEATGTGSNSSLQYVTSGSSTQPSQSNPYPVDITQLATKGSYVASTAQTQPAGNAETLTFGGNLLRGNPYNLVLNVGATLAQTVSQINSDPTLSKVLTASINGNGDLELDSLVYGTPGNFTVSSNEAAGADTTGIGTGTQNPTTAGLDVAGTINGEAATGSGQSLTGNSGNATTSGLEILYTGTATGDVGTMTYTNGLASQLNNLLNTYNNPGTGLIATADNGLAQQVTTVQSSITSLQAQLTEEQANLTQEFNNMETLISQLQTQSAALSALDTTSSSSSSSSGNSSLNSDATSDASTGTSSSS